MRYLMLYKPRRDDEPTAPPTKEHMAEMGKLIDEMNRAGVLLTTEGCAPSAKGARVRISSGAFTVMDGPFPETKELIQGLAVVQTKSKAEAIEWAKRFLSLMGEGESEIRQLHEASDFA